MRRPWDLSDEEIQVESRKAESDIRKQIKKEGQETHTIVIQRERIGSFDDVMPVVVSRIQLDDEKLFLRLVMVEYAKAFIECAYRTGYNSILLNMMLCGIVTGEYQPFPSVGKLFEMYGRFQEKFGVFKDEEVYSKMRDLVGDEERDLIDYPRNRKTTKVPIPYAVRNALAHPNIPIDLTEEQIQLALELLNTWNNLPNSA